jgi:hypothetical protein
MVKAGQSPSIDPSAGVAALEEDIPKVLRFLGAPNIEALGWLRPNNLSLIIPMTAEREGNADNYSLRLGFQAYRRWPPSAQFVNPNTHRYDYPQDQIHVPKLTSPECHTHTAYDRPGGGKLQLICCSATLEFYDVLHSVENDNHLWQESYTFYTTIMAITRAMASSYQGRFSSNGK